VAGAFETWATGRQPIRLACLGHSYTWFAP
jgi:hypothetical protein